MAEQLERVAEVAQTDDHLATLVALRNTLARAIDACDSLRDLASLSARLTDVLNQITAIRPPEQVEGDEIDEITARRASRGASASAS